MDGERFDNFAKTIAGMSRRSLLRAALGAALGGTLGAVGRGAAAAAGKRGVGGLCRGNGNCASGLCGAKDSYGRRRCPCVSAGDCPQPRAGDPCRTATCDGGACGTAVDAGCVPKDLCATAPACAPLDQCHDAGVCNPATGVCSNPPKANGTPCDDGNACSQTDTCQSGVCVGGNPVVCTPLDACHEVGVCDPATGLCSTPAKPDGTPCSDDNAWTQTDTCRGGVCTPGTDVVCVAADQCHDVGTCNPATGACSNPAKTDGTACDDGNLCTQTDTCQDGTCTGGNPVVCAPLDQCHTAGTCDPQTGQCSNPQKPDGATCDDGNLCTQTDTCQDGSCVGNNPVVCNASDQCHDAGVCDPKTGKCSNPAKTNGTACIADNSACTVDTCQAGVCTAGATNDCSAQDDQCNAGVCNPTTGLCEKQPKANGTPCDDGNACTRTDTCQAGVCVGSNPVVCTASDQCHVAGTCNASTGQCSNPPKANGTTCNDGNACTRTDTCQSGTCVGSNPVVCTASDQCHSAGTCDPSTGTCSNPAKVNGTACNADNSACTVNDTCQNGTCTAGTPKVCTALDECHVAGTCDPSTGNCSNPQKGNGTACSGGTCCNGTCCPSGRFCCGNGANNGCCTQSCCGGVCCTFSGAVCCPDHTCRIGVSC